MADLKKQIMEKALSIGFDLFGVAPVDYVPERHDKLLRWLDLGYNADMHYLTRATRKRYDPRMFYKDSKSIIVVGVNYYNYPEYNESNPYISIYARGQVYQDLLKEKLTELLDYIKELVPSADGKVAVDRSPTSDKLWAQLAGIGWQGKNSVVINRKSGSFIFLGEVFLNLELEPDSPDTDHCADCTQCLESCPTGALEQPYILNAAKCISYHTETAGDDLFNPELVGNHLFGCDICQIVCPYNRKAKETKWPEFQIQYPELTDCYNLKNLTESEFERRYQGTILAEYGFRRISRNAKAVLDNLSNLHNGS